jgi:integrase
MNSHQVKDVRDTVMITLAFYAFLRVSELMQVRTSNLSFKPHHLELEIPTSKCDQLRQGSTVVIARLGGKNCPVEMLEHYLNIAKINMGTDQFIFRRLCKYKEGFRLIKLNKAISYGLVRDLVKEKIRQLGLDPAAYGTHSMRAGGATAAASKEVDDRLFQRHGRWATVQSKNKYIVDTLENRLKVTQALSKN